MTDCLAVIDGLAPLTGRIDGELRQHAKAGPRVKVLTTLPGVGQFTALMMLAEIGGITRFPNARKLASQSGLTPAVRGPDLKVRHGHISEQGPAWLRWVLNQAAQSARRSPKFAATYQGIAKRRGKKIATIAIARKLLTAPGTCWPACKLPQPSRDARQSPSPFRRLPASSSSVLTAARLRALQLDPWPRGSRPGSSEEGSRRTVSPARRRA